MDIVKYKPEYQPHFERLNKAWLNKYFEEEPVDKWVLSHPEAAILQDGGAILFARHEEQIIGTVALRVIQPGIAELTKMAVDEAFQGLGAGSQLCKAAIEEARALQFNRLILYSSTRLARAIGIYRKLGFKEIPAEKGAYKRCDIKMELTI
ncbi:acetyltransferase (GNAT) family protein [Anseongella ginsenosidimutans]|uniref:Acetyltransferase (GNAT) family protein n=1 Tax=Anseongella ginsenosidimutans TaxID=496056 RepID=A0A4R3KRN9_9SPHI|nr:GNAT family N-acetyltransferase [Anseongella ginsenosidimutans]QEC53003.1 GNAT family N-acetyltransferase [Anseongella ginsenosidimutans]TCS87411.1 acetyltransferase (GNAT) family protein [Anseongella ginsenosidimutans]